MKKQEDSFPILGEILTILQDEVKALDDANVWLAQWQFRYSLAPESKKKELFEELLKKVGIKPKDVMLSPLTTKKK